MIGDVSMLPDEARAELNQGLTLKPAGNTGLNLIMALSYSSGGNWKPPSGRSLPM